MMDDRVELILGFFSWLDDSGLANLETYDFCQDIEKKIESYLREKGK